MKKRGISVKSIYIVVIALLLLYLVFQVYQMAYDPVKTQIAAEETVYDSVSADAVFVRDEQVVKSSLAGTMVYSVKDGARVQKGGIIANAFVSDSEADAYTNLTAIEKQISYYENIIMQTTQGSASLDVIDSEIENSINEYIRTVNYGNLSNADEQMAKVSDNITNRKITIGEELDVNSILNELYTRQKELKGKITDNSAVKADSAGYFISSTDGSENGVDYSKAAELSVTNIKSILKQQSKAASDKSVVGKIIQSFDWYTACAVNKKDIIGLEKGDEVTVGFPQSSVGELTAEVESINVDANNTDEAALVLKFDDMDEDIATIRNSKIDIRFNSYTGIRIPNEAIRAVTQTEDGEQKTVKCVYVLSGNVVRLKRIDIIYNGEDFVLTKSNTTAAGYVRLYDKVIVKGDDLSDGKIVKYTGD